MNNNPYEPMKQMPYGPYQPAGSYEPTVPASPGPYQPINPYAPPPSYQLTNPYAPPPPPYQPTNPYIPQQPVKPPGQRNKTLLIAGIVAVLIIGSFLGLFAVLRPAGVASTPTPTPTLIPTPVSYPAVANAYSGSVHNTSVSSDANMALTSVMQDKDKISGTMTFGLPLVGSGPFTGTVASSGAVHFVVNSKDAGSVTLTFSGSIASAGSMSGTYTVNNGQTGTWKAAPASSPVVYPVLFPNYSGNYNNTSTSKSGAISIQIITQNQQNFNGTFARATPLNGTVGSDNSIQFTITDTTVASFKFVGTVNIDGSLSGTYTASTGGRGAWKVSPA